MFVKQLCFALIITTLFIYPFATVNAEVSCRDLAIVFARGSGQNPSGIALDDLTSKDFRDKEAQSYEFFNQISSRLAGLTVEKVTIHNFEGRYNQYGYKAVSVAEGMSKFATHRNDASNLYYESVKDGAEELAWYLEDKMTSCPLQQVVLGGYSQGAQVVGDALNLLPAQFRSRIAYTALFGDPKFNSRLPNSPTPKVGYWARGSANGLQTGSLGARVQYVPDGIANVGSWCDKEDPVCSARYALANPVNRFVADYFSNHVHSTIYQEKWIPQAANEIVNTIKARLPSGATKTQVWLNKNDKSYQMDIALVLDGSGSMVNQLDNIKAKLSAFVNSLYGVNWDTRVAVVAYDDDPAIRAAYLSKVLNDFTYDKTVTTKSIKDFQLDTYPHDIQEAMYSGIMTAFNDLHWRDGAQKKTIVITDAPAKDPDPGPQHWTKEQVAKRALELDPVSISFVSLPAANQYQSWLNRVTSYLTTETNGTTKMGTYSYSVSDITALLDSITYQPVAILTGDAEGVVNQPVHLNAGESYDPDGAITSYRWDCANDGVFDAEATAPTFECTYTKAYSGYVVMEAKSSDGGSAKAILQIAVAGAQDSTPSLAAPQFNVERVNESTAKLNIVNSYAENDSLLQLDDDNNTLGIYAPTGEITLLNIDTNGKTLKFIAKSNTSESGVTNVAIPEYVPPVIETPPVIIESPPAEQPPLETEQELPPEIIVTPPAETELPDSLPIIDVPKELPPEESNPQWMLDATAGGQSELNAQLAQEKILAQNQATNTPPQEPTSPANKRNNTPAPTTETTPTTKVAGISTKAAQTPVVVPANQAAVVANSPDVTILITALALFGFGILLIIWWLSKKTY